MLDDGRRDACATSSHENIGDCFQTPFNCFRSFGRGAGRTTAAEPAPAWPVVNFDYAFGYPHRITVALPDSSNKTLVDCAPGQVTLSWTYGNLMTLPVATFETPRTQWHVVLRPEVDGQKFPQSSWHRAEGWLPVLEDVFTSPSVRGRLEVVGGGRAAMVRMEFTSLDRLRARTGWGSIARCREIGPG